MVWENKKLGDICANMDSQRKPISKKDRIEGEIPYYGASGIVDYVKDHIFDEDLLLVSEDGANLLARTYPIAFSVSGKTWVNNHAHVLRFSEPTTQRFVEYYLNSISLVDFVSGMAQPKLNQRSLNSIPIPLPEHPEQKRIVTLLDKAFAEIEQARALAEKNLNNARELFESYLQQVFSQRGEGWEKTTLGESCQFSNGKAHEKEIDEHGSYIVVNSKFISQNGAVVKKTNNPLHVLCSGDIVMVMSDVPKGKALAKCFVIPKDDKYTLNQRICSIKTSRFDITFLYYQLNRHPYLLAFDNKGSQANLRKSDVLSCPLYIPDIKVQKHIGNKLNALKENISALETNYLEKLRKLDLLKKSILQQAFSGQLMSKEVA